MPHSQDVLQRRLEAQRRVSALESKITRIKQQDFTVPPLENSTKPQRQKRKKGTRLQRKLRQSPGRRQVPAGRSDVYIRRIMGTRTGSRSHTRPRAYSRTPSARCADDNNDDDEDDDDLALDPLVQEKIRRKFPTQGPVADSSAGKNAADKTEVEDNKPPTASNDESELFYSKLRPRSPTRSTVHIFGRLDKLSSVPVHLSDDDKQNVMDLFARMDRRALLR